MGSIEVEPPRRVGPQPNGGQAQEALAIRRMKMAPANADQCQVHHRTSHVAGDEVHAFNRREPPPRSDLPLFDVGRGVGT